MLNSVNELSLLVPTGSSALGIAKSDAAQAGESFSQTFANVVKDAAGKIENGEATALAGMQGKASVQQVAEAVMQAEQTLHSMVAVRDKVVSAYLEISRMQV